MAPLPDAKRGIRVGRADAMKSSGALLLTATLVACGGTESQEPTSVITALPSVGPAAVVVHVIDGDTIDVLMDGEVEERVRLIGIDSPELGECYGDEATQGLARLIDDETVYLERDVSDRDQFGRLLRYVWTVDDVLVNEIVVQRGWAIARDYPPDIHFSADLHAAESRARDADAGLWAPHACATSVRPSLGFTRLFG